MKKILLTLFALASVSAMATEGINVYGKVGLDVYSHYNKIGVNGTNQIATKSKGKVAPSIALEVTKDLGTNFEAGLGLGYVWHGKRDLKFTDDVEKIDGKLPAINSIPLYVTGKYNFNTNSNLKPYIKADLGYSFNRTKKSLNAKVTDIASGQSANESLGNIKVENGLYTSVGVGVEYMNVTADLSYVFTGAKYKQTDEGVHNKIKANNSAIRLTVGYKFSF